MRIKDALGEVIADVRAVYGSGDDKPYYMYGRPLKIANLLSEKTKNQTWKYKKYPLVMLLQDFTEDRQGLYESDSTVTIVIVAQADAKNRKQNRDDANFDNILYPIYELFIKKLEESTLFDTSEGIEHSLTESPYYGASGSYGNTGNVMNDTLDALFLENFNLKLIGNC